MALFTFDFMINIVYPMLFGAGGGLLAAVFKYKGELEMPTYRRLKTKTVFRLGFLKEVLLGVGAGAIAANLFYAINAMPAVLVAGIIAAFAGLAGAKYLFKENEDTRTLDGEVTELIEFLTNKNKDDDK